MGAWTTLAPAALGHGRGASDIRLISAHPLDNRLTEPVESRAVEPMRKLIEREPLSPEERFSLALFLFFQERRSPDRYPHHSRSTPRSVPPFRPTRAMPTQRSP